MRQVDTIRIANEASQSKTLAKLDEIAQKATGAPFQILLCKDGDVSRLQLSGKPQKIPEFCRMIRSSVEGMRRCSTCRSLIALRACYEGLTDYACHGGISVLVAPAVNAAANPDGTFLVVSSCAFAESGTIDGWKAAREHAQGLPIDLRKLREAYQKLPVLTDDKRQIARALVDTAASAILEISGSTIYRAPEGALSEDEDEQRQVSSLFNAALQNARHKEYRRNGELPGNALTSVVMAIIHKNPAAPFTVAKVARAARMTPNHFSTVFRKHAGMTFMDFLTEERLNLAKQLLLDPAIPIGDAALQAGFTDTNYFSRRFKQRIGESPSKWQKSQTA